MDSFYKMFDFEKPSIENSRAVWHLVFYEKLLFSFYNLLLFLLNMKQSCLGHYYGKICCSSSVKPFTPISLFIQLEKKKKLSSRQTLMFLFQREITERETFQLQQLLLYIGMYYVISVEKVLHKTNQLRQCKNN